MRRHLKRDERPRELAETATFSGYILPNGKTINGRYTIVVRPEKHSGGVSARPYIIGTSMPWSCPMRTFDAVKKWVEAQFTTKVEGWKVYEESHVSKA
jgi:hypothetical protein